MRSYFLIAATTLSLVACSPANPAASSSVAEAQVQTQDVTSASATIESSSVAPDTAIFAGGCFWCIEADFEKLPGVLDVVSGYTGGATTNPDYKQVTFAETGHYEAVKVSFDSTQVTYPEILAYFWRHVDPTDPDGQFCDKGSSYRTAIFARPDQIEQANASKADIEATKPFSDPIVTPVLEAAVFYDAEDYHQDYYKKNPLRYRLYRTGCGRDVRTQALWGNE